jgi:predicted dehydrogenase
MTPYSIGIGDVVLLATPPHFRPDHVAYAAEKGKHMFVEKPIGVDGPGVRKVRDAMKVAEQKGLSVVSGLCWRYHNGMRSTFEQIHAGKIGEVITAQCTYNTGGLWTKPRQDGWSDMEYQMRNWLYYTWLSGDHIAEQAIHSLDKMQWAFNDAQPKFCYGVGGRQARVDEKYGHVFDHFGLVYDYGKGKRGYHFCRQQVGTDSEVNDFIYGREGWCNVFRHQTFDTDSKSTWRFSGKGGNMYQLEHNALFTSIREGKPINNGSYMCDSTLVAVMGRMAAYTGKKITWEMAANSKDKLGPDTYAWGDMPTPKVAIPGVTRFS